MIARIAIISAVCASFLIDAPALHAEADAIEPPAKLTASLDRKSAHIGDSVILTLKYYVPEGIKFESEPKLEGLEGFAIIDKKVKDGEIILTIIVDRLDKFEVGPVSLSYKDKDGIETLVRSEAVSLEVLSNLGDKPAGAQLKPIMEIIPVTPLWLKYLPWAAGVLVIAAAAAWFFWWRKRKRAMQNITVIKPPHVVAREEIEKLQSMKLFEKGLYKEFYFRLSEILRQYIESIRDFPAAEFTTEEIARRLRSETDRKILPLLRESDLVKFADAVPAHGRKDDDVKTALDYIRETSPLQKPAGQGNPVSGTRK